MFQKLRILVHYFQAKRRMKMKPDALRKWQLKRKKAIFRFARKYSSFYREHAGNILSKKIMMDHFSSFNTKGIDKTQAFDIALSAEKSRDFSFNLNGITVGMSSGTSGNRGLFLASEAERLFWCGYILARALPKAPWRRQKIAFFLRANSTLYETIQSKTLSFAYFDLLEDPLILREKLKDFAPDVLVAPPSMLLLLIGSCIPKRVISVAEVLSSSDEKRLEKGFFQKKIFQIYQCTEGFLGHTCSEGTLHINEDLIFLEKEYLDESRFVPIITDLFRKTQPILRYRLDDVLVEKKGLCPCGSSFLSLERIEGRCNDLLQVALPNGGSKPLFPDFVARKIIAASEEIEEYELVQTRLDRWEIFVKPSFQILVKKALEELFEQVGCVAPTLVFMDKPFKKTLGAKLRRIRREDASL